VLRIDGALRALPEMLARPAGELLHDYLGEAVLARLGEGRSVDLAVEMAEVGRFRVNAYRAARGLAAAIRVLPLSAPTLAELHLPMPLEDLVDLPHGLVIVCGPTGAGKSATLAALASEAVRRRRGVLISLEDPIEYVLEGGAGSIVRQREVGRDVRDFAGGLRDALREDPDVLLIGEMRDPETIDMVLTAAETGHLVLTSLHSRSAPSAIERIVDACPAERHGQVRLQLGDALRAIVSQRLLPRLRGPGRLPAVEVLRGNQNVASLVREGKTAQLVTAMQSGRRDGMVTLESCLAELVRSGMVSREAARVVANDVTALGTYLAG
jgi:twitching motility protein PilT